MVESFDRQNRVDLWNWLANPREYLNSWPGWKNFPDQDESGSFDFAIDGESKVL